MATRKYWEAAPADPIFDSRWDAPRQRLTEAGNDYLLTHQTMPPRDGDARADSISGDGLRMTTTLDASNRPHYTFESVTGRKDWLNPWKAQPGLMIAMTNNTDNTRKQAQRYLQAHPDAVPMN